MFRKIRVLKRDIEYLTMMVKRHEKEIKILKDDFYIVNSNAKSSNKTIDELEFKLNNPCEYKKGDKFKGKDHLIVVNLVLDRDCCTGYFWKAEIFNTKTNKNKYKNL